MLRVDPTSSTAPFEQVRQQIIDQITAGTLAPGTKLPSVRRLAADLDLAPNTVARTYRELEAGGYVRTAGRNGTVVATPTSAEGASDRQRHADEYVRTMRGLGVPRDDIVAYVHRAVSALD